MVDAKRGLKIVPWAIYSPPIRMRFVSKPRYLPSCGLAQVLILERCEPIHPVDRLWPLHHPSDLSTHLIHHHLQRLAGVNDFETLMGFNQLQIAGSGTFQRFPTDFLFARQ